MIRYLFKRVMILCAVLAAVSFFAALGRPLLPLGIIAGGFLSVYKLRLFKTVLTALTQGEKSPRLIKTLFIFIFILMLDFLTLFAAVKMDIWLFFGISAGLASTAAVICVTALAAKAGLTRNDWWEDK